MKRPTIKCISCGGIKPVSDFPLKSKSNLDGTLIRGNICVDCISDNEERICRTCGILKDIRSFSLRGNGKRRPDCNECRNAYRHSKKTEQEYDDCHGQHVSINEKVFSESTKKKISALVGALLKLARNDITRLDEITEDEFVRKTNCHHLISEVTFSDIRKFAEQTLMDMGFYRPSGVVYKQGRYLVVSDSHGKHTKKKMFKLLKSLNKRLEIDRIFHIGHIVDDDNVISYCWKELPNVTVISKIEEAPAIEKHLSEGYEFDVVRDCVYLGKLKVMNQDLITDYVKTFVGTIDPVIFSESMIVNGHRHELDTRCVHNRIDFIASPGCLCEKHIVKTIKQIDFTAGYQVKEAKADGFKKYRRMKHMSEFWEMGCIVVEVDEHGDFSIIPCRIKEFDDELATVYFDRVFIGDKETVPDKKIFINTDMHCDAHDEATLDIQEQVVNEYRPDIYINLGDAQNNKSLNHHEMSRGAYIDKSIVDEHAELDYILQRLSEWADVKYYLYGNHERFIKDFHTRYPQLVELLNELLLSPLRRHGYQLINHKEILDIGSAKFLHGDLKMFGQSGSCIDKIARTFGKNVVLGHLHFSAIRFGNYIVPMSGCLDQEYNEVNASRWVNGFAICAQYRGESWITVLSIVNNKLIFNGSVYTPDDLSVWQCPEYNMTINYNYLED